MRIRSCLCILICLGLFGGGVSGRAEDPANTPVENRAETLEGAQRIATTPQSEPASGMGRSAPQNAAPVRPIAQWTTPTARVLGERRSPLAPVREGDARPIRLGRHWVAPSLVESGAETPTLVAGEWQTTRAWRGEEATAPISTDDPFRVPSSDTFTGEFETHLVRRYEDAPVAHLDLLKGAREAVLEQLSLADVNRYQFRRNRSTEPGIPVEAAGGENVGEVENP